MRRTALWGAIVALAFALTATSSGASTTYTHGYDISWPQCHGSSARMPKYVPSYLILGLTHGVGHSTNPCLSAQLQWAEDRNVPVGAYLVPSYPTKAQLAAASSGPFGVCGTNITCRLRTDGARQTDDALAVMKSAGVPAPMVWVDVEFRHQQAWSHTHSRNVAVLQGVFDELHWLRMRSGVYTTSYMWKSITGGVHFDVPNWLPSGDDHATHAAAMCRRTATGGPTWLVQYTHAGFDSDLTCPVMNATWGKPGPLWQWRWTTLQLGSKGAAVSALQRAIKSVSVNGRYDAQTTGRVVGFQAQRRLPVTGRINNDDWRALGAYARIGAHGFLLPQVVASVS